VQSLLAYVSGRILVIGGAWLVPQGLDTCFKEALEHASAYSQEIAEFVTLLIQLPLVGVPSFGLGLDFFVDVLRIAALDQGKLLLPEFDVIVRHHNLTLHVLLLLLVLAGDLDSVLFEFDHLSVQLKDAVANALADVLVFLGCDVLLGFLLRLDGLIESAAHIGRHPNKQRGRVVCINSDDGLFEDAPDLDEALLTAAITPTSAHIFINNLFDLADNFLRFIVVFALEGTEKGYLLDDGAFLTPWI